MDNRFFRWISLVFFIWTAWYLWAMMMPTDPIGEIQNGKMSSILRTLWIEVMGNAGFSGNLSIWTGSSKLCLNGRCYNNQSGVKTCSLTRSDLTTKWCPQGTYLSHIGTSTGSCRYFDDNSQESITLWASGNPCNWWVTYLAIKFNSSPPYITNIQWAVQVNTWGVFIPGNPYDELYSGSVVETAWGGWVVIVFADNSIIRLWENTRMILVYDESNTTATLETGELWARVLRPFTQWSYFTLETGDLSAGVRWTSVYLKKDIGPTIIQVIDSGEADITKQAVKILSKATNTTSDILPWSDGNVSSVGTFSKQSLTSNIFDNEFLRLSIKSDISYLKELLLSWSLQTDIRTKITKELENAIQRCKTFSSKSIKDSVLKKYWDKTTNLEEFGKILIRDLAIEYINKSSIEAKKKKILVTKYRDKSNSEDSNFQHKHTENIIYRGSTESTENFINMSAASAWAMGAWWVIYKTGFTLFRNGSDCATNIGPKDVSSTYYNGKCYWAVEFDGAGAYRIHLYTFPNIGITVSDNRERAVSEWIPVTEWISNIQLPCEAYPTNAGKCHTCISAKLENGWNTLEVHRYRVKLFTGYSCNFGSKISDSWVNEDFTIPKE